jgi:hypothetical protein
MYVCRNYPKAVLESPYYTGTHTCSMEKCFNCVQQKYFFLLEDTGTYGRWF